MPDEFDELVSLGPPIRFEATWEDIQAWARRQEIIEAFARGDNEEVQHLVAQLDPVEWITVRLELPPA